MKHLQLKLASAITTAGVLVAVGAVAAASGGGGKLDESLTGYQEVPALSTSGAGEFHATISDDDHAIRYRLTFSRLETDATQAHIHFENATNNGNIVVFLCSNLGNGPAGTQALPGGRRHHPGSDPRRGCRRRSGLPGDRRRRVPGAPPRHSGRRDLRERAQRRASGRGDPRPARLTPTAQPASAPHGSARNRRRGAGVRVASTRRGPRPPPTGGCRRGCRSWSTRPARRRGPPARP